jgi:hypothetical protein
MDSSSPPAKLYLEDIVRLQSAYGHGARYFGWDVIGATFGSLEVFGRRGSGVSGSVSFAESGRMSGYNDAGRIFHNCSFPPCYSYIDMTPHVESINRFRY